jgi:small subunit ribosomal protein S24e
MYILMQKYNRYVHLPIQNGLQKKVDKSRKQKKEKRNRMKKVRGVKKAAGAGKKK